MHNISNASLKGVRGCAAGDTMLACRTLLSSSDGSWTAMLGPYSCGRRTLSARAGKPGSTRVSSPACRGRCCSNVCCAGRPRPLLKASTPGRMHLSGRETCVRSSSQALVRSDDQLGQMPLLVQTAEPIAPPFNISLMPCMDAEPVWGRVLCSRLGADDTYLSACQKHEGQHSSVQRAATTCRLLLTATKAHFDLLLCSYCHGLCTMPGICLEPQQPPMQA